MSEQKKISELDPMTKAEAAGGAFPVAVSGKTVCVPIDELGGTTVSQSNRGGLGVIRELRIEGPSPYGESATLFNIFKDAQGNEQKSEIGNLVIKPPSESMDGYALTARFQNGIFSTHWKKMEEGGGGGASVPTGTPALSTMGMNEINAQTNNYGSWNGDAPEWGAESMCQSICFQLKRMSMGNGTVNTCHVYISQPGAQSRFKVGIFATAGNELGATDVVDVSNTNKPTMMEIPMTETADGSLTLNSGEMYVIKVVAIGVGFGGSEHSKANWNFDNNSHFNISTTMAGFRWASNDDGQGVGNNNIPFVAFSYKENG